MDDMMGMLKEALNDPDTADKLNGLIASLGGGQSESAQQADMPDMTKLMQIGSMIQQSGSGDSSVALLVALRPLLKEETQVKLDRVIKIFRLMSAYPMLRDSGLLELI